MFQPINVSHFLKSGHFPPQSVLAETNCFQMPQFQHSLKSTKMITIFSKASLKILFKDIDLSY